MDLNGDDRSESLIIGLAPGKLPDEQLDPPGSSRSPASWLIGCVPGWARNGAPRGAGRGAPAVAPAAIDSGGHLAGGRPGGPALANPDPRRAQRRARAARVAALVWQPPPGAHA